MVTIDTPKCSKISFLPIIEPVRKKFQPVYGIHYSHDSEESDISRFVVVDSNILDYIIKFKIIILGYFTVVPLI
jgi:hypothetical protein